MSEIILRDICKSYENGFQAVKNFNLEIEKDFSMKQAFVNLFTKKKKKKKKAEVDLKR